MRPQDGSVCSASISQPWPQGQVRSVVCCVGQPVRIGGDSATFQASACWMLAAPLPTATTKRVPGHCQVARGANLPGHGATEPDGAAAPSASPLGPAATCLCDPQAALSLPGLPEDSAPRKPSVLRVTYGASFSVCGCLFCVACVALRGLALFCPLQAVSPSLLWVSS